MVEEFKADGFAERTYGKIPEDMEVVNIVLTKNTSQILGLNASSNAAYGASVPLCYDPDTETDQDAMTIWDIELVEFGELSSEQANNLGSHWSNRELAMEREEIRRAALIAAAPVITRRWRC